jgi:hypothetical protein
MEFKGTTKLAYYKENSEEDYIKTPISVLRYISELESHSEKSCAPDMLEMLEETFKLTDKLQMPTEFEISQLRNKLFHLIKKATEI